MANGLTTFELSSTESIPANVSAQLDPRLQWWVVTRQAGLVKAATASTARNEIAVIARVADFSEWEELSEVRGPSLIANQAGEDSIVTGRIPISRIEAVRRQAFVKSLKAAQPLRPQLDRSVSETEAGNALSAQANASGGRGVVVGIIDYGGDVAHENFRRDDGTTRLVALWNQDGASTSESPFGYGEEHTAASINRALRTTAPYAELRYDPSWYEDPTDPGAHGTHVMDIAAGNGRGTRAPGLAPEADLVFVNISHTGEADGAAAVGKSFGDSVRLLEAAKYIFDKADGRPCVVNISLGTNGGPHDGTTLVEQGLDALVSSGPNRAIVIAAANAFDDGIHASGKVEQGGTHDLIWRVSSPPRRDIELELWYPHDDRFTVELLDPGGVVRASVPPGQNRTLAIQDRVVFVANRLDDPNNGDNMIGIFFSRGIAPGAYKVRLRGDTVASGNFHAWIERDNSFTSQFAPPHDNSHTIGSIACGHKTIAVGSYDGHKASLPLSFFSSAGPSRDGRQKPEISAPGHNVRAALSSSVSGSRLMSGTSMAAPAVAGIIALVFAAARARGLDLDVDTLRSLLIEGARRRPPGGAGWHAQYGFGRIHARGAVEAVLAMGAPAGPSARGRSTGRRTLAAKKSGRRQSPA